MKTTQGRWFVDSDSLILSYDNGRCMRIFSFPPGEPPSKDEALAWISGTDRPAWMTEEDLKDLVRALDDLFGGPPSLKTSWSPTGHQSELVGFPGRDHIPHAVGGHR